MNTSNNKLLGVEGIRGIACFIVVLHHLNLMFFDYPFDFNFSHGIQKFIYDSPFTFLFSGNAAVYVFFVLSGYILSLVATQADRPMRQALSMALKRYPRLMLPTLASCLIAYFIFIFIKTPTPELSKWINDYGTIDNDGTFIYSLYGAFYSGTIETFTLGFSYYNWVLWTMKIELIGSFIIYMLCANQLSIKLPALPLLTLIILLALIFTESVSLQLGLGLIAFCGGYLFQQYGKPISTPISLALILFAMYLSGVHHENPSYGFIRYFLGVNTYYLCNFIAGFLFVYAALFNQAFNRLLSHRLCVFMGKVSFSVYLIHLPIISALGMFSVRLFNQFSSPLWVTFLGTSLITIIFTYLFSMAFYRYVDLNSMRLSNALAKKIIARTRSYFLKPNSIEHSSTKDEPHDQTNSAAGK